MTYAQSICAIKKEIEPNTLVRQYRIRHFFNTMRSQIVALWTQTFLRNQIAYILSTIMYYYET